MLTISYIVVAYAIQPGLVERVLAIAVAEDKNSYGRALESVGEFVVRNGDMGVSGGREGVPRAAGIVGANIR